MATSPITRSTQRAASPAQGNNNHTSRSGGNPSAQNSIEQGVARTDTDQASRNSQSNRASSEQYRKKLRSNFERSTGQRRESPPSAQQPLDASSLSSPLDSTTSAKRVKYKNDTFSTPTRSPRHSTPTSSPGEAQPFRLIGEAREGLKAIGIPEKVISKLEVIIGNTKQNYGLCGSAALALHMRSAGLTTQLNVGDLDVVYTGTTNDLSIAGQLKSVLKSPASKIFEPSGQILLARLKIDKEHDFNIDVVQEKIEFATRFTYINGLSVATLESLKKSYQLTKKYSDGEKAEPASRKLDIISDIENRLNSKKSSPT